MKNLTHTHAQTIRYARRGFAVLSMATLAIVTLFAFEAAPMRGVTNEALAWSCSIQADSVSTSEGADVTLRWNSASDVAYVTIDQFPGEQLPQSGTKNISITETTTFTAYTHVTWTTDTLKCTAKVVVTPPPPVVDCTDFDVEINGNSFTWSGSQELEEYTVEFCDGTKDTQYVCYQDSATFDFQKRIKSVNTCGGDCYAEATQDCPPPPEEPEWPACPFTERDGTVVVHFDGKRLVSNSNQAQATSNAYDVSLPAGTYTVRSASWDGYLSRVNTSQPHEAWYLDFMGDGTSIATTRATTDLKDYVIEWLQVDTLEGALVLSRTADTLYARHAFYPDTTSPNSVQPICAEFTIHEVEEPEEPVCTIHANPVTVLKGGQSTISWTSDNATSVVFNGLSSSLLDGSTLVSPATTTTYTGTFHGEDGTDPAVCTVTVTVVEEPNDPVCSIHANPSTIVKGGQSTITWTSTDALSVIFSGLTSTLLNGTANVSPATTTTYIGTFYGATGTDADVCTTTVTVVEEPDEPLPVCTMSISPTQVSKGDSATLTWTSDNATSASINQGVGTVVLDGSRAVTVNEARTYTGTFSNADGDTVTCSADVRIKTGGGGGRCLNCDDDDDDDDDRDDDKKKDPKPSIVLSAKTTKGTSITLDQVPYTGFKASPLMTVLFWITIFGISGAIAYMITMARNRMTLRSASAGAYKNEALNFVDYSVTTPTQVRQSPRVEPITLAQVAGARTEVQHAVEERAHRDNILLSPEATRMIVTAVEAHGAQEETLGDIFERAKGAYPREDGWILLSKERCTKLLATPTEAPMMNVREVVAPVVPQATPRAIPSQSAPTADAVADTVSSTFVRYLATNDQAKAFELLRNVSAQGVDVATFIGRVVRDLDEVYKHRIEGNRKPDQALVQLTERWSTPMFETILGSLVECIDYSYSNTRIGVKVALAKVFEVFTPTR